MQRRVGVVALLALIPCEGCRSAATPRTTSRSPECVADTASPRAAGDLDGALDALARCSDPTPAQRVERAELLAQLGDVTDAKAAAREILALASRGDPTASDLVAQAEAVVAMPDPPHASRAEALGAADALAERARTERGAARGNGLAKARHAYARALGARAEPILVERVDGEGGWAADHPIWSVQIRPLPLDDRAERDTVAIGVVGREGVRLTHVLPWRNDYYADVERLGPTAFAIRTGNKVRVLFTGDEPPPIERDGDMAVSARGDLFAVSSNERVDVFDVSPWRHRFTIEALGGGRSSFTADQRYLMRADSHPGTLVAGIHGRTSLIDVEARATILDEPGYGSLSPSGKTLAIVQPVADDAELVRVRLRTLGPSGASDSRDVDLGRYFEGALRADFAGEDRVTVIEGRGMMRYSERVVAVVDVRSAKLLTLPEEDTSPRAPSPVDELRRGVAALLPKGRSLVNGANQSFEHFLSWDTGLFAVVTTATPCASLCAPELFVVDTVAKKVLGTVPLATQGLFMTRNVSATKDERFLIACGASDALAGSFVVDLKTFRISFTGAIDDCMSAPIEGHRVWTKTGVVDLGDDDGTTRLHEAPVASDDDEKRLSDVPFPRDMAGLFCRFGDLLRPYDVCERPPR